MNEKNDSQFPFIPLNLIPFSSDWVTDYIPCLPDSPINVMTRLPDPATNTISNAWEYFFDATERTILFWDVMRKRGNNYLERVEQGKPPVLYFDYEMLIDGRTLDRPCNYALLRILTKDGVRLDPMKRPYVIIDPRAGHGPGIGGFKDDSEVGVAMRAGHTVYFISFFPEPVPGQTLEDVEETEALFIQEISKRHPESRGKPVVIGNCQAGWAVAALAAIHPDIMGPVVLNGAPLSYWAGADGKNPMRYAGGLLGGKWLAYLASDLGNGKFDGAHLVANFENLNPANTLWSKHYNLYANIDTEEERYLAFEKWWGGYFFMNAKEIEDIVSELFIGNKLETGEIVTKSGKRVDLKNIQSPIVIFASWGDNITPPQQALNWIVDVYTHEDEIVRNGQVIVYILEERIGHLGIFVSGTVAKKEHAELFGTLEVIDELPPGLYEMKLTKKTDYTKYDNFVSEDYLVEFETRKLDDIRALDDPQQDEEYFSSMAAVSEINHQLYQTWLSPWVKLMANDWSAEALRQLHPLRLQHVLFSDLNPFMAPIQLMGDRVRQNRHPVSQTNYFLGLEKDFSQEITEWLNGWRDFRDNSNRHFFKAIYGPLGLGAIFPTREHRASDQETVPDNKQKKYLETLLSRIDQGGFAEAVLRMVLAALKDRRVIERRSLYIEKAFREHHRLPTLSAEQTRLQVREQWLMLHLNEERALRAVTKMLPNRQDRLEAVKVVLNILMTDPSECDLESSPVKKVCKLLDIDLKPAAVVDD